MLVRIGRFKEQGDGTDNLICFVRLKSDLLVTGYFAAKCYERPSISGMKSSSGQGWRIACRESGFPEWLAIILLVSD